MPLPLQPPGPVLKPDTETETGGTAAIPVTENPARFGYRFIPVLPKSWIFGESSSETLKNCLKIQKTHIKCS